MTMRNVIFPKFDESQPLPRDKWNDVIRDIHLCINNLQPWNVKTLGTIANHPELFDRNGSRRLTGPLQFSGNANIDGIRLSELNRHIQKMLARQKRVLVRDYEATYNPAELYFSEGEQEYPPDGDVNYVKTLAYFEAPPGRGWEAERCFISNIDVYFDVDGWQYNTELYYRTEVYAGDGLQFISHRVRFKGNQIKSCCAWDKSNEVPNTLVLADDLTNDDIDVKFTHPCAVLLDSFAPPTIGTGLVPFEVSFVTHDDNKLTFRWKWRPEIVDGGVHQYLYIKMGMYLERSVNDGGGIVQMSFTPHDDIPHIPPRPPSTKHFLAKVRVSAMFF